MSDVPIGTILRRIEEQGAVGPIGPTGSTGIQGPIGLTGLTGAAGPGRLQAFSIGDGVSTSYTVTHTLNSKDVLVQVYRASDGLDAALAGLITSISRATTTTVGVTFALPPATNAYRVVITGA